MTFTADWLALYWSVRAVSCFSSSAVMPCQNVSSTGLSAAASASVGHGGRLSSGVAAVVDGAAVVPGAAVVSVPPGAAVVAGVMVVLPAFCSEPLPLLQAAANDATSTAATRPVLRRLRAV